MPLSSVVRSNVATSRLEPIFRVAELRQCERRYAHEPLMERAGLAAAEVARKMTGDRTGPVIVLAGPGNNGGDAFVVARCLRTGFHDVIVVFRGNAERLPEDARAAHAAYLRAGGTTSAELPDSAAALIVDGLFGIGLRRPPASEYAEMIEWANRNDAPVLSLDIPSGLDADTGAAFAPAIHADATATFIALKPGLLTGEGVDLCGEISTHRLGIEIDDDALPTARKLEWQSLSRDLPDTLKRRHRNVHKGTFGTLAIVGGAHGMVGAPLLAGRAATKVGAGKVRIGFVALERPAVDVTALELMLDDANAVIAEGDCLLIGPGLGTDAVALNFLERALVVDKPLVLDADALNVLAKHTELRSKLRGRHLPTFATPHPAEAARILATDTAQVESDRVTAAQTLARELNALVVLKGAGSVLAYPDGSFDINASGGPALATAGSGDVLAGILGAFVAQGLDPKTALRYAACLHGASADALVARGIGPTGLVASELPDSARSLLRC
jgi:ADP-dependent NAD(P)H-hydrate dehydratase / NAD(P)H-hydrate epimerase